MRAAWRAALRRVNTGRGADPACDGGLRRFRRICNGAAAGWAGPDRFGGIAAPACNVFEKQVVFGATARLREQIKNTVKIMDGGLHVVLSSCATEMIGDDIPAMAKEARDQGFPVLSIASAGFRGTSHDGVRAVPEGCARARGRLVRPAERDPRLVNLLGIVPRQDAFWEGDLAEWSRLLAGIGLRANPVFGLEGGIGGLRDLTRAGSSLVVSPWGRGGRRAAGAGFRGALARYRRAAGRRRASAALCAIWPAVSICPGEPVEAFIAAETRREDHHPQPPGGHCTSGRSATRFRAGRGQPARRRPGRLPDRDAGLAAKRTIVVADGPPEAARPGIESNPRRATEGYDARVLFSEDAGEIEAAILESGRGYRAGTGA